MSDIKITMTASVPPVTIECVPPGAGIVAPDPVRPVAVRVYHSGYGCDTGCCGHVVELTMADGSTVDGFDFDHPHGAPDREWALALAKEMIADRWPECADSIDWSTADVDGARDC